MFHYRDGLFFGRNEDGSVRMLKTTDGKELAPGLENLALTETIDANGWASIVASVSKGGEENGRYYQALNFHNGEPPAAA